VAGDEINVAIAFNVSPRPGGAGTLLQSIAQTVADADIPEDYDLFDPDYPCRVPLGLAPPVDTEPTPTPVQTVTVTPTPTPIPTRSPTAEPTRPPTAEPTRPPTAAPTPPPASSPSPTRPRIGLDVDPDRIWEAHSDLECGPTQARVSAVVVDPAGVRSVEVHWQVGEESGDAPMQHEEGDRWSATIGPFAWGTLAANETVADITVTVVAVNDDEQPARARTDVPLHRCQPVPQ
jgi:hypothetical protein